MSAAAAEICQPLWLFVTTADVLALRMQQACMTCIYSMTVMAICHFVPVLVPVLVHAVLDGPKLVYKLSTSVHRT